MSTYSTFTNQLGVVIAKGLEKVLSDATSNTYLGIGMASNASSGVVTTEFLDTIENKSSVFNNLVAIKKINSSDINLVIPDSPYEASYYGEGPQINVVYDQFDSNTTMYTHGSGDRLYPLYAKNFYVRNSYDQVFLCLSNNKGSNSNTEPVLRPEDFSSGQLVESLSDGYLWRYLYTIPSGLKEKFAFYDSENVYWIPVVKDTIISLITKDGAIEALRVTTGGADYNAGTPGSNANIITITGDGNSAVYFANVQLSGSNTTITDTIAANSGIGYSYATVTASGGDGNANLRAVISPAGGFGADPASDLGAKFLALSVELTGTVGNTLPIISEAGFFNFRQVSLIRNPQTANGDYITVNSMAVTSNIEMTGVTSALVGDKAYQGSIGAETFQGTIVSYDYPHLLLNNTVGTFSVSGGVFNVGGSGLSIQKPDIKRSGEIVYVENLDNVQRSPDQFEQIKIVFKF